MEAFALGPDDPAFLTRVANPLLFADLLDEARAVVARARELAPPDFLFEPDLRNDEGVLAPIDGRYEALPRARRDADLLEEMRDEIAG